MALITDYPKTRRLRPKIYFALLKVQQTPIHVHYGSSNCACYTRSFFALQVQKMTDKDWHCQVRRYINGQTPGIISRQKSVVHRCQYYSTMKHGDCTQSIFWCNSMFCPGLQEEAIHVMMLAMGFWSLWDDDGLPKDFIRGADAFTWRVNKLFLRKIDLRWWARFCLLLSSIDVFGQVVCVPYRSVLPCTHAKYAHGNDAVCSSEY